jgi:hypothetical protein
MDDPIVTLSKSKEPAVFGRQLGSDRRACIAAEVRQVRFRLDQLEGSLEALLAAVVMGQPACRACSVLITAYDLEQSWNGTPVDGSGILFLFLLLAVHVLVQALKLTPIQALWSRRRTGRSVSALWWTSNALRCRRTALDVCNSTFDGEPPTSKLRMS